MQPTATLAGIDVSAKTLDVRRRRESSNHAQKFPNDQAGHRDLIKWLGKGARVCVEATGVYHLQLALALRAAGIEVMVINPRVARDFSRSLSNRSKTDVVDAEVLLEYVVRMEFTAWNAPSEAILELRELGRRISELVASCSAEKNRLHAKKVSAISKTVIADVRLHIGQIGRRIEAIEREALKVVRRDADLAQQYEILIAIKGVGRRSALLLLTELAVLDPTMTVRQLVAHAGLDPRVYESGTSVRRPARISKVGNARIRAILFMVALSAARRDRGARAFRDALRARGKGPLQALVAVMRKLLHGIWIALTRRIAFDGSILFAASLAQAESSDSAVAAHQPEPTQDHPQGRSAAEELRQQLDPASAEATRHRKAVNAA
jgi:transposase